jgi:hypothetical protein
MVSYTVQKKGSGAARTLDVGNGAVGIAGVQDHVPEIFLGVA